MSIIQPGMSPMSSKFIAKAMKIASKGAATVKSKKDLGKTKEEGESGRDAGTLSDQGKMTAKKQGLLASQSGVTSETAKKEKKKSTDELKMFGGDQPVEKEEGKSGAELKEEKPAKTVDPATRARVSKLENQRTDEIMEREPKVPDQFRIIAEGTVKNQIVNNRPKKELTQIKDVPEPSLSIPDLKLKGNVEIAPIHDTKNEPIPMEMGTGVKK